MSYLQKVTRQIDNGDELFTESYKIDIRRGTDTDEIIKKKFKSLLKKYQESMQVMKGCCFGVDSNEKIYLKFHIASLKRGGTYIPTPSHIKNKKTTTNVKNKDNKCFH